MSTLCSVFVGSGRYPSMFENQMNRKTVARNGNQRRTIAPREVALGDRADQPVVALDDGLQRPGRALAGVAAMRRATRIIVSSVSPQATST